MVNKKPLIIAAIMGIIAVALVFSYLKKVEQSNLATEIEYGKVVVAKTQIPVRTKIKEPMLDEIIVPLDAIHKDAVLEVDEILGKVTNQVIFEGEQILSAKFEDALNLRDLAFIIDEGKRGVAIGVSDIKGLGGNVKPGDHVDVVGVFQSSITGVDSSFTILTDVMVKAVGKSLGPEDEDESGKSNARTVTLEVTPQQAEKLILSDEKGSLRLTLRHPDEIYTPLSNGTNIFDVVKYFEPPNRDKETVTKEPLPEYPDYFNGTPEPDGEVEFDFDSFTPVEKIRIELIMGGKLEEIFIEKPIAW
ncbi:Flp pilus assembly protein CpaB [bacterium]|nr:Flp pilus assembly protein CpaB [bacterium]